MDEWDALHDFVESHFSHKNCLQSGENGRKTSVGKFIVMEFLHIIPVAAINPPTVLLMQSIS